MSSRGAFSLARLRITIFAGPGAKAGMVFFSDDPSLMVSNALWIVLPVAAAIFFDTSGSLYCVTKVRQRSWSLTLSTHVNDHVGAERLDQFKVARRARRRDFVARDLRKLEGKHPDGAYSKLN